MSADYAEFAERTMSAVAHDTAHAPAAAGALADALASHTAAAGSASAGPRFPARLLQYAPERHVALAAHASVELIDRPPLIEVPGAPYYCAGLMRWQGLLLPLIDLHLLLRAYPDEFARPPSHVLVVAYQSAPGEPLEYGALRAPELVQVVQVSDAQRCALPGDSDLWPYIASSCFEVEGRPVPIIELARIFGQPHG